MKRLKDYSYIRTRPKISPKAFIANGVKLIGAVIIGDYSSVWYNTVIRADINKIEIGAHSNIQDLCSLHVSDDSGVRIGDGVIVGHGVVLHACTVEDSALVGMGSRVLDGARIGKESVVAAASLVAPGFIVPPRTLVKGLPAKVVRRLTKKEIKENLWWAAKYEKLVQRYRREYEDA